MIYRNIFAKTKAMILLFYDKQRKRFELQEEDVCKNVMKRGILTDVNPEKT